LIDFRGFGGGQGQRGMSEIQKKHRKLETMVGRIEG
jgi:hypothetical protein